jgi:streptogramin lyase
LKKKWIYFLLLLLSLNSSIRAQVSILTLFVMKGSGDNLPATWTDIFGPNGLATDRAGNLYISCLMDERVRKVDAKTHIITTVAGNGVAGFSGDNGAAIKAELNGPTSVVVNKQGDIFITDSWNGRIRRIDGKSGIITTVAGGGKVQYPEKTICADSANFYYPNRITEDTNDNIYFRCSEKVYRLDLVHREVMQDEAGNKLYYGNKYSTVDNHGNLYYADEDINAVEEIDAKTCTTSVIVRDMIPQLKNELKWQLYNGIAVDDSGNIFLSGGIGKNGVIRIDAVNKKVSWYAGIPPSKAAERLADIIGWQYYGNRSIIMDSLLGYLKIKSFAADTSGNIYFTDSFGIRLKKIDVKHDSIYTVAELSGIDKKSAALGDVNYMKAYLYSIAADLSGNIYYADDNRIKKFTSKTGMVTTIAGNENSGYWGDGRTAADAGLKSPTLLAFDKKNNLYIADDARIRKIDAKTNIITTVAGNGTVGQDRFRPYQGDGGLAKQAQILPLRYIGLADCMTIDAHNNIFLQYDTYTRKIDAKTGIVNTIAGKYEWNRDQSRYNDRNTGFVVLPSGGIYKSDIIYNPGPIRRMCLLDTSLEKYNPIVENGKATIKNTSSIIGIFQDSSGNLHIPRGEKFYNLSNYPFKIIEDSLGNLWVEDMRNGEKLEANTNFLSKNEMDFSASASDDSGNIYLSHKADVYKLDKADNLTYAFGGNEFAAQGFAFNSASGLSCDSKGNVYLADGYNSFVYKINSKTKIIIKVAGNDREGYSGDGCLADSCSLHHPNSIAVDSAGDIYVLNECSHICKIDATTHKITTVSGNNSVFSNAKNQKQEIVIDAGSCHGYIKTDKQGNLYYWVESGGMGGSYQGIEEIKSPTGERKRIIGKGGSYGQIRYAVMSVGKKKKKNKKDAVEQIYRPPDDMPDGGHADSANIIDLQGFIPDNAGNIYLGENNGRIRKVNLSTGLIYNVPLKYPSDIGLNGSQFSIKSITPQCIEADKDGNICFFDSHYKVLMRENVKTGELRMVATNGLPNRDGHYIHAECLGPLKMISAADGKHIYIIYLITADKS